MIEILTLFLGLYHGTQPVELRVGDGVAEVEVRLDGEAVGRLSEPPWTLTVDLGEALEPHELVAVARDALGRDVGRARRWINLEIEAPGGAGAARPDATAVVVDLDPSVRLPPPAEMGGWFSAGGEPLEVLRIEEGAAEVAIVMDPAARPYLDRTASVYFQLRLGCGGRRDAATLIDMQAFVAACRQELGDRGDTLNARAGIVWKQWRAAFSFGDDADVRFISPRAAPVSRVAKPMRIFNFTTGRASNEYGLLWHGTVVRPLRFRARLADAVAIAGLEVHAGRRRRAVVAMTVDHAEGRSRYPPATVRSYLEDLRVPLYVWNFGIASARQRPASTPGSGGGGWRHVLDLTHGPKLGGDDVHAWLARVEAAVEDVRKALGRQRVVWLEGARPPHRVELSEDAAGVRLAGAPDPVAGKGVD